MLERKDLIMNITLRRECSSPCWNMSEITLILPESLIIFLHRCMRASRLYRKGLGSFLDLKTFLLATANKLMRKCFLGFSNKPKRAKVLAYSKNQAKRKTWKETRMRFLKYPNNLHLTLPFLIRLIWAENQILFLSSEVKLKLWKFTIQRFPSKAMQMMTLAQCPVRWLNGIDITCLIVLKVKCRSQVLKFQREEESLKSYCSLLMKNLKRVMSISEALSFRQVPL